MKRYVIITMLSIIPLVSNCSRHTVHYSYKDAKEMVEEDEKEDTINNFFVKEINIKDAVLGYNTISEEYYVFPDTSINYFKGSVSNFLKRDDVFYYNQEPTCSGFLFANNKIKEDFINAYEIIYILPKDSSSLHAIKSYDHFIVYQLPYKPMRYVIAYQKEKITYLPIPKGTIIGPKDTADYYNEHDYEFQDSISADFIRVAYPVLDKKTARKIKLKRSIKDFLNHFHKH